MLAQKLILSYYSRIFSQVIRIFTGTKYTIAVNPCTSDQFLMSQIIGLKPGDEISERIFADDIYTLIRRELYEEIGGYDTTFFLQCEEYDWQARAKQLGYKIMYTPYAKIWHKDSMTLGKTSPLKAYYNARNPMLVILKHKSVDFFRRYFWLHFKKDILKFKIKFFGLEGFDLYYPLMKNTNEKTGEKTNPGKFYKNILETYFKRKQAAILLAEGNGEFIPGIIVIGNQYVMHYWQGASKRDVTNLGQGELLQWEAIKWAKLNGTLYYDLCVIERDKLPHIAIFKLGFSKYIVPFYLINKKCITYKIFSKFQRYFIGK